MRRSGSAAAGVFQGRPTEQPVEFAVHAETKPGSKVLVVGSADALGKWSPEKALQLSTDTAVYPRWSGMVMLRAEDLEGPGLEYKFVTVMPDGSVVWEDGPNRQLSLGDTSRSTTPRLGARRPSTTSSSAGSAGCTVSVTPKKTNLRKGARSLSSPNLAALIAQDDDEHLPSAFGATKAQTAVPEESEAQPIQLEVSSDSVKEVEVVFEPSGVRKHLKPREAGASPSLARRWSVPFTEMGLSSGVYSFYFLVDGERTLSSDHPVRGDCNTALFGGAVRKYILARTAGQTSEEEIRIQHAASLSQNPGTWGRATSMTEINGKKEAGKVGRARSIGNNLAALAGESDGEGSDDEAAMQKITSATLPASVFDGLFGRELKLRLCGFALDEAESLPQATPGVAGFKLWSGAHKLKKRFVKECEDAYFLGQYGLGVADGVGGMAQFKSYGVNSAEYAQQLMECAAAALLPGGCAAPRPEVSIAADAGGATKSAPGTGGGATTSAAGTGGTAPSTPKTPTLTSSPSQGGIGGGGNVAAHSSAAQRAALACREAEARAEGYGSSTVVILVLEGQHIGVANLGDSGFMVLRRGPNGMAVVHECPEQQHGWNFPYQLTRLPKALAEKFPHVQQDHATDCQTYVHEVHNGDLILMYSDGLRDNLHDCEILDIVESALSPTVAELLGLPEHATPPDAIAKALALAAQARSLDPRAKVPFYFYSRKHGYDCPGGKEDDITVLAAWVGPQRSTAAGKSIFKF